jgi:hypothetical protein
VVDTVTKGMIGNPESYRICTSIVERGNLSIRTSAPSHALNECLFQEVEHLKAMLPLYSGYYNFCRIHLSIRCTPAMESELRATFGNCAIWRATPTSEGS